MVTGSPVHVRNVYRTAMPPAVANPNPDRPRRGASAPTTALVQREASSDEEAAPAAVPAAPVAAQESAAAATPAAPRAPGQLAPVAVLLVSAVYVCGCTCVWHLDTRGLLWIQSVRYNVSDPMSGYNGYESTSPQNNR